MPGLQLNKLLGALTFGKKGMRLPTNFEQVPIDSRNMLLSTLSPAERVAIPTLIPEWFKPALPIAPHQDACDTIGRDFKDLHDTLCDAVVYGHNFWRLQAKFTPMPIAGPVLAGPPGCLTGPPLADLIKRYPQWCKMTPDHQPYLDAVAEGVGKLFMLWQSSVTVPGLPLFPAFAMQPPGSAIPTPAIPQKLIACVSSATAALVAPPALKEAMIAAFPKQEKDGNPYYDALFEALSVVFALGFVSWLADQMVVGLVGSGAVTSPLGGPVAGVTLPTAGHLAT